LRRIADARARAVASFFGADPPIAGAPVTIDATQPDPLAPSSLATRARTLANDLRDLVSDHLELAALEARRAGEGFARVVCAAVVVSILWVSAWLALLAGAIVWATSAGVPWAGALAIAAIVNVVAGAALVAWMRRQVGELPFAATLRQIRRDVAAPQGGTS
jgi:uncharacterized membrane protein YqjE